MDNDSSRTNVLDLIADRLSNKSSSLPNNIRVDDTDTEPCSSGELHEHNIATPAYPSQEAKQPGGTTTTSSSSNKSSSYPSQNAKDVNSTPRSRSVNPTNPAGGTRTGNRTTATARSVSSSASADPRRQRRRRRYHREQQTQQQQQQLRRQGTNPNPPSQRQANNNNAGPDYRRVNSLPVRPTNAAAVAAAPPPSDEEIKRLARATSTGPIYRNSVDVEMSEEFDVLQIVALRASSHEPTSSSSAPAPAPAPQSQPQQQPPSPAPSSQPQQPPPPPPVNNGAHNDYGLTIDDIDDSSVGSSSYTDDPTSSCFDVSSTSGAYEVEVAAYAAQHGKDDDSAATRIPSRASMDAVQYIMNDLSNTSIPGLKGGTTNVVNVTQSSSRAMASSVAGAYSAAPGQGLERNEAFQRCVLGSTNVHSTEPMDSSLQYSFGGTLQEHSRRVGATSIPMGNASNKSHDHTPPPPEQAPVIAAVPVNEDDLELHIREQITSGAAQAEVVDLQAEKEEMMKTEMKQVRQKYFTCALTGFLVITIVIVVVAVTVTNNSKNDGDTGINGLAGSSDRDVYATLGSVTKKGHLNCGLSKRDENAKFHPEYEQMWEGFNGDWCRAIAAATFDGDVNVTIHRVTESERWEALRNGTLDVLVTGTPASTESLHFDLDKDIPATFSTPFLFDGVGVGGMPEYIEKCATTKGFENYLDCKSVRVCACQGSAAMEVFEKILHPSQIVEATSIEELYSKFANGCCNMLATDWSNERAEVVVRNQTGYTGEYALGEALYTKQPYALATRKVLNEKAEEDGDDDVVASEDSPQAWSDYVDWVLQSLIAAEQSGITKQTANQITETEVFGDKYRNAFKYAVGAVGNYGEVYERNMAHVVPRDGMNKIADGSTGLHYHHSIGDVTDFGTLDEDGTLAAIKKRGKLICGVPVHQNRDFILGATEDVIRPAAMFLDDADSVEEDLGGAGIDIEFCRALASSIFQGLSITNADSLSCLATNETETKPSSDHRIEFVFLEEVVDGFTALKSGKLDVISGYRMTLAGDVREPATRKGYTFSQPFLYGPVSKEEHVTYNNRCMVTRQDDQQWSDFVQISVMSLFYAEENHIDQSHANRMPYVNLFGPTYKRMMKDSIFAVGNYGEVYDRLVEPYLPRAGGPNELNMEADPQLCSFPGIIV